MTHPEIKPIDNEKNFKNTPPVWLQSTMKEKINYLLAFTDDAVLWGKFENGQLSLSSTMKSDMCESGDLRAHTIQQIRLFGSDGEIVIWQEDGHFLQSSVIDGNPGSDEPDTIIEEDYLLWGESETENKSFSKMVEGQQNLLHIPPFPLPKGGRLALSVKHFIRYDEQGQARIAFSRLTGFKQILEVL
jgi:CRISPR-associated protein (TIGR03984 family)